MPGSGTSETQFSGAGFSLRGFVLAKTKTRKLKHAPLEIGCRIGFSVLGRYRQTRNLPTANTSLL
jgi:hypothetical protein